MPATWTAPRDWAAGETVTASIMNTHIRDDLKYLKGALGAITLDDQLYVSTGATTESLKLNSTGASTFLSFLASGTTRFSVGTDGVGRLFFWNSNVGGIRGAITDSGLESGSDSLPVLRHSTASRHVEHGQASINNSGTSAVTFINAFASTPTFYCRGIHSDNTQDYGPHADEFNSLSSTGVTLENNDGGTRYLHWIAIGAD